MTEYLPLSKDLINIVESYIDADNYTKYLEKVNKLNKTELISGELKEVETREVLKFKLAHNCAKVLIQGKKIRQCDIHTLTGVLMNLLHYYKYETLYNTNDGTILLRICEKINKNIHLNSPYHFNGINHIVTNQEHKENMSYFSEELKNRLRNQWDITIREVVVTAYNRMIESEELFRTVPWYLYADCLENYIHYELNRLQEGNPLSQGKRIGSSAFGIPLPKGPDIVFPGIQRDNRSFIEKINDLIIKYFPIILCIICIVVSISEFKKLMTTGFPEINYYKIAASIFSIVVLIVTLFFTMFSLIFIFEKPSILKTFKGNIFILSFGIILGLSYNFLHNEFTKKNI
jgi:hypothetical protein